jgi:hypothetical protein
MPSFSLIPEGSRYGRLVVCGGPIRDGRKPIKYPCRCDCGGETTSTGAFLRFGVAASCGCKRIETLRKLKTTHGESKTRLHVVWCGMKARCSNKNHSSYKYYGGKGIKVGSYFGSFSRFKMWAERNGYREGLTIERIDSEKDYTPKNCTFADRTTQNRNSGSAHNVKCNGKSMCLEAWSEITGVKSATIRGRLKRGWPVMMALTKKVKTNE